MNNPIRPRAKATSDAEQSDGIVVSFGAKWHPHLIARDLKLVIRKRTPRNRKFSWLYFHVNSPVSAICGRAKIESISRLTLEQAIAQASNIKLSPEDIRAYVGRDSCIGCYQLKEFQSVATQIYTSEICTRMIYFPPQSFLILSNQGKELIDQMIDVSEPEANRSRRTFGS
jgi:predicted transcriptional regulator